MKNLVVYDSAYGNTAQIASAIAKAIKADIKTAAHVTPGQLADVSVLIVGSPTQGGLPTQPIRDVLKSIPAGSLKGVQVAAFDTRFDAATQKAGLRLLMKIIGYAAGKILAQLRAKGGRAAAKPEGFIVLGTKGPLKSGELARAAQWAKEAAALR